MRKDIAYEVVSVAILGAEIADYAVVHAVGADSSLARLFRSGFWAVDAIVRRDARMGFAIMVFLSCT